jgi:hypothetical protein
MAAIPCTVASYVSAGACFTRSNFSRTEQQAIKVYRLAQLVSGVGGTDYTTAATLWAAANTATCGMTEDQVFAGMISVLNAAPTMNSSAIFGTSPASLTLATAAAAIACLKEYSPQQLDKMELFLWCSFFGLFV